MTLTSCIIMSLLCKRPIPKKLFRCLIFMRPIQSCVPPQSTFACACRTADISPQYPQELSIHLPLVPAILQPLSSSQGVFYTFHPASPLSLSSSCAARLDPVHRISHHTRVFCIAGRCSSLTEAKESRPSCCVGMQRRPVQFLISKLVPLLPLLFLHLFADSLSSEWPIGDVQRKRQYS